MINFNFPGGGASTLLPANAHDHWVSYKAFKIFFKLTAVLL